MRLGDDFGNTGGYIKHTGEIVIDAQIFTLPGVFQKDCSGSGNWSFQRRGWGLSMRKVSTDEPQFSEARIFQRDLAP